MEWQGGGWIYNMLLKPRKSIYPIPTRFLNTSITRVDPLTYIPYTPFGSYRF